MNDHLSLPSLASLITIADRVRYLERIDTLISSAFSADSHPMHLAQNHIDDEILSHLSAARINRMKPTELQDALNKLKLDIQNLNEVVLRLAFTPSQKELVHFSDRLNAVFKSRVLIRFELDPPIWGGAVIEYQGAFHDLSLRRSIIQ